jgi:hypothetical protein
MGTAVRVRLVLVAQHPRNAANNSPLPQVAEDDDPSRIVKLTVACCVAVRLAKYAHTQYAPAINKQSGGKEVMHGVMPGSAARQLQRPLERFCTYCPAKSSSRLSCWCPTPRH